MNQAMGLLSTFEFWSIKTVPRRSGKGSYHECSIRDKGKHIRSSGNNPIDAINLSLEKISKANSPKLKLRGRIQ